MSQTDTASHHAPATPQAASARTQATTQAKSDERPQSSPSATTANRATSPAIDGGSVPRTVNPVWSESATTPQLTSHAGALQLSESHEPTTPSSVTALHEAQQLLPEPVKPNNTGEILLQLGGKDQAAAIRVSDRGGAVNVSVHAADPGLRTSLRSSLGELATQLSHQGWKTDVVKSGTLLTRAETSQDFRQDGQRSPSQQQPSAHSERQAQKDRRANSGQWLAELEEQSSGNSGNRGGTN